MKVWLELSVASFFLVFISNVNSINLNPLNALGKCITDKDCKHHDEFCDHTGINPMGDCRKGYENGKKCTFDRHCSSKHCHFMKCVARKPERDGPCSKDQHQDCIESQYCGQNKEKKYQCQDRVCSGWCSSHSQCVSNKCCWFYRCKSPKDGCHRNVDKIISNKTKH